MPDLQSLTESVFDQAGYVVLRSVLSAADCDAVCAFVNESLAPLVGPAEFEADLGYPGSPKGRSAPGGATPRRLLHAYARSPLLRDLAGNPAIGDAIARVVGESVLLSQCHHNCVMTKHPGFSSATLWHQDIRYWSFDEPELVSAWYAVGDETQKNGALKVIPGSHKAEIDRGRFDRDLFLRPDLAANRELIERAVDVELNRGDVLLFHCRLFHAAGKNFSSQVKISPVFTYHALTNAPIPGTRSAQYESLPVFGG